MLNVEMKPFKGTNVTRAQLTKAVRDCNSEKIRIIVTDVNTRQIENIVEFYVVNMMIRNGRELSAKINPYIGDFTNPNLETSVECLGSGKVNHYDHPIEQTNQEPVDPPTEFEDSGEATEAILDLQTTISDVRFQQWFDITDYNYGNTFGPRFAQIKQHLQALIDEFMDFEE
jgi:hypothetical protein